MITTALFVMSFATLVLMVSLMLYPDIASPGYEYHALARRVELRKQSAHMVHTLFGIGMLLLVLTMVSALVGI